MSFIDFKLAIQKQFDYMCSRGPLFVVETDKDTLWSLYLESFPAGTNLLYRKRTEHDCSCCKQFIRNAGNIVTIIDNELVSIWDIQIGGCYQVVADALAKEVTSRKIKDAFIHYQAHLGTDFNREQLDNGEIIRWNHFHYVLPQRFVLEKSSVPTAVGNMRESKNVFKRSLDELTIESAQVVLDLIDQNSLYRGEEHRSIVDTFLIQKSMYDTLATPSQKDNYVWFNSMALGHSARIRNTVIGTLLTDISDGVDLERAVNSFEQKVAPGNYKRPTALITKKMIENAQKRVDELGLTNSLPRRHATKDDITINNVLFADRDIKKAMNVFDELSETVAVNPDKFNRIEEIGIDDFIQHVLPKASSIELLFENKHCGNLMSLIAPAHKDAKHLFKWNNNFSWTYNGEVTDSVKERVKKAGGNVDAVLRLSLSWSNYDDLDIHVVEPSTNEIFFSNKTNQFTTGQLDVDMNAGHGHTREPVENIVWTDRSKMLEGEYIVFIHNYQKRESIDIGFEVEMEYENDIVTFVYDKSIPDSERIIVVRFLFSRANGIDLLSSLPKSSASKIVWNIPTQQFQKVSMIMSSPNHWDGQALGNRHWFFILDKCKNPSPVRGFFNEYLSNELNQDRKVLEVLGAKMKATIANDQLSGVGFSSTKRNSVVCRVTGSFTRTVKINF